MHRTQRGDSLIEIIFAIVVIGLVVSAITAAISTSENGSVAHRQLVTGDSVLRNYAESVKSTVRATCTSSGGTWSASFTPPSGYAVNAITGRSCSAVTTTDSVAMQVTLPNGTIKSMSIRVRTS